MNELVETPRVLRGVAKRWYLVLILTVIGASLGYAVASSAEPMYQASVSILVGQPFQTPNLTKDNLEVGQQVALTYADVIQREPVLGAVVKELGLNMSWSQLSQHVKALPAPQDPQLIVVTVSDSSRPTALAIAAAIAKQAVALSPSTAGSQASRTRSFISSRLEALQSSITAQQARLNDLRSTLKTIHAAPGARAQAARAAERARAGVRRQINNEQRLLISSQQSYASLASFYATQQVPNSLQVLESAHASLNPVKSGVLFKTLLAAVVGLFLGLGLAYILEFRADASAMRRRGGPGSRYSREEVSSVIGDLNDEPQEPAGASPASGSAFPRGWSE
jgi:tyrosine-protein kinase